MEEIRDVSSVCGGDHEEICDALSTAHGKGRQSVILYYMNLVMTRNQEVKSQNSNYQEGQIAR